MNDLHQKYLDEGETVYATKLDSVIAFSGDERAMLQLYVPSTRVEEIEILWGDEQVKTIPISEVNNGIVEVIIPNLEEGNQIFNLYCYDSFGNSSLPLEVNTTVYGAYYKSELVNRRVLQSSYVNDTLTIDWGSIPVLAVDLEITYSNLSEEQVIINVPFEDQTVITGYKPGSDFQYRTFFKPEENCIDTFAASYSTIKFD